GAVGAVRQMRAYVQPERGKGRRWGGTDRAADWKLIEPVDNDATEIPSMIERITVAVGQVSRIDVRRERQRREALAGNADNASIAIPIGRQNFCDRKNSSTFIGCDEAAILDLAAWLVHMVAGCHGAIAGNAVAYRDVHVPFFAFVAKISPAYPDMAPARGDADFARREAGCIRFGKLQLAAGFF